MTLLPVIVCSQFSYDPVDAAMHRIEHITGVVGYNLQ